MAFRRRAQPAEPARVGEPPWRHRLDEARRIIRGHGADPTMDARLDDVEHRLLAAEADHAQLTSVIAQLDPERATRELKDALRARERGGSVTDDAITALRRRHETVHQLQNRREELRSRIDATVADVEHLAGRTVEVALVSRSGSSPLGAELDRIRRDLTALEQAHDEIRRL